MLPVTAGSLFDRVRALQNDTDGAIYTDDAILPYCQIAQDDLNLALQEYNIPVTNATSAVLSINEGQVDIGGPTGPALPLDFIDILDIAERTAGTSNDFMRMQRLQFLPQTEILTAYLQVWSYQNQIIKFLGANGNIEVQLHYIADTLGYVENENSQLRLFNVRAYLQYRTAGHCSMFVGENETRANLQFGLAQQALDAILNINIKSTQGIYTRRRPFRHGFRTRGLYPG